MCAQISLLQVTPLNCSSEDDSDLTDANKARAEREGSSDLLSGLGQGILSYISPEPGHFTFGCGGVNWVQICSPQSFTRLLHLSSFIMTMILFPSVLPFEYGDKDWRVAIKLRYRNMVQESRHNHKSQSRIRFCFLLEK